MAVTRNALETFLSFVNETIGKEPVDWPGGYPNEVEAALIDAIFSVRAHYGNRQQKTGVYGAVWRWREHRGWAADDLNVLAECDPEVLAGITNRGRISRRSKAEVVIDAANSLRGVGVATAADLRTKEDAARGAYLSVKGCGRVTWAYLRMLVGMQDVKADTWVMRFVQDRLPSVTDPSEAAELRQGRSHPNECRSVPA